MQALIYLLAEYKEPISVLVTVIAGLVARNIEKKKLRKQGKLKDE